MHGQEHGHVASHVIYTNIFAVLRHIRKQGRASTDPPPTSKPISEALRERNMFGIIIIFEMSGF